MGMGCDVDLGWELSKQRQIHSFVLIVNLKYHLVDGAIFVFKDELIP